MYIYKTIDLTTKKHKKNKVFIIVYDIFKNTFDGKFHATIYITYYDSIDKILMDYVGTKKTVELYFNGLMLKISDIKNWTKSMSILNNY